MGGLLTSFKHVVVTIASNNMFTQYSIYYQTGGQNVSFQAELICSLTDVLTMSRIKVWCSRFNGSKERHMPFNIFTMCHQLKIRFALTFLKQDTSSNSSQDQGLVHKFIDIKE